MLELLIYIDLVITSTVIASIQDDKNKFIDSYGDEYTEWQNLYDTINVLTSCSDFLVTVGNNANERIIQQIIKALDVQDINDIYECDVHDISLDGLKELKKSFT